MPEQQITVIARMKAKAGHEKEVREFLISLIGPTRSEEGCLDYRLHEHLEQQGVFVFYENWKSQEHLDRHLQTPYLKELFWRAEEFLDQQPEVTIWKEIGE